MSDRRAALVTGGGSGIGAATCLALAEAGAVVCVTGRDQARLEMTASAVRAAGGEAHALVLDVTDPGSVEAAVAEAKRLVGEIEWLVANAGIAVSSPIGADPGDGPDLHMLHMDVNYHGVRRTFEALLPGMRARSSGCAVMIASSAALEGSPYVSAYSASKHALLGYSRCAALELHEAGVAVNVICPHWVDTPMMERAVDRIVNLTDNDAEQARTLLVEQNGGGVLVQPEEVASAAVDLLRGARTGVVIELPGGSLRVLEQGLELASRQHERS